MSNGAVFWASAITAVLFISNGFLATCGLIKIVPVEALVPPLVLVWIVLNIVMLAFWIGEALDG